MSVKIQLDAAIISYYMPNGGGIYTMKN